MNSNRKATANNIAKKNSVHNLRPKWFKTHFLYEFKF